MIRQAKKPKQAADMGRDKRKPLRSDWEKIKDSVMREVVLAKFTQNKGIRKTLLSTGSSILVENSPVDNYWGCGKHGNGQNKLGIILMSVREELRAKENGSGNQQVETENKNQEEEEEEEEEEKEEENDVKGEGKEVEDDEEEGSESSNEEEQGANQDSEIQEERHHYPVKRLAQSRQKARRRRGMFVDADGSATLEKNTEEQGTVNVVGTSNRVVFSEKALPASAKVVLYRNQFRRKWQATEEDFEEHEEDYEDPKEQQHPHSHSLADFISTSQQPQLQEDSTPTYLLSPQSCIDTTKSITELLKQLPKDDFTVAELIAKLHELKPVLEEFISQTEQEELMIQLLQAFDNVTKSLEGY